MSSNDGNEQSSAHASTFATAVIAKVQRLDLADLGGAMDVIRAKDDYLRREWTGRGR